MFFEKEQLVKKVIGVLWLSLIATIASAASSTVSPRFTPHASDPYTCGKAQRGETYFNTVDSAAKVCDGTAWRKVVQSGTSAAILAEDIAESAVGTSEIADAAVATADIAANAVTAAKVTTTMATGTIQLPLNDARELTTAATINAAGNGGVMASDTTPVFERVNGATDQQLRLRWASSNSDEITWSVVSPADLDDAANVSVCILANMAGATDTPTVTIEFFEAVGDTDAGGATAALSQTVAAKCVTVTAANIAAAPQAWSISVTPGAHTTDAAHLYGAYITYTRK